MQGKTLNRVAEHEIDKESQELYEIYGDNGNRLFSSEIILNPELKALEAERWTMEKLAEAKLAGKKTGFVAGSFDLPQENHDWYIRHSRLLLAKKYLQDNNKQISLTSIREAIESDKIFLVVGVESDIALDQLKSHDKTKGGAKRPIYGWQTRANRIAGFNFQSQFDCRIRFASVDLVTAFGPEYDNTALEDYKTLPGKLHNAPLDLIDEQILFSEYPDDIQRAREDGFDPLVISKDLIYCTDPLTGEPYKSSKIINRIRS